MGKNKIVQAVMKYIKFCDMKLYCTFIWLSAESFKPVISKTFTQVVIGLPYFFDAEGYNQMHMSENDLRNFRDSEI